MDKNAIEYWYPKIKDKIPTPRTAIVPIIWNWDKTGNFLEVADKYLTKIKEVAQEFNYPLFIRGSDSSIKHSWKDTCFVKNSEDLTKQVIRIVNETLCLDVMSSVPCTSIAIREYIEMDSKFTYFWGELPISPERRYFINNGKVVCHHPYWTKEAIRDEKYYPILKEINSESIEEKDTLDKYSRAIAKYFDSYWSIDFCKAKSGKWYCIDMATGNKSWHPKCSQKL